MLRAVPPARRGAVFDATYAGRDLTAEAIPDAILEVLPHTRRHAAARRMLALPAIASDTAATRRITAFLPYREALPVLTAAVRSADADERADGYQLLVRCAARTGDPAVLVELLGGLTRIRNERDPVRCQLLSELAAVRPEMFDVASVPLLDDLVVDAIDAWDCSWQTRGAIRRLVYGILTYAVADDQTRPLLSWALDTLELLGEWRYSSMIGDLRRLRRGQEHEVCARMRPFLAAALDRGDAWPLLGVAASLGRRAWQLPELQDLLGRAVEVKEDSAVRRAVDLWLAPPRTRSERVGRLVDRVGCHNCVTVAELGVYAAGSYSLIRPPSTARRVIRWAGRAGFGSSVRGGRSSRLRCGRRSL
jgi:hypothetical protein